MILVDVNVLIYAFREGADQHQSYAAWLNSAVTGPEELLLPDTVLGGFLRIVTNARIMEPPASISTALAYCRVLRRRARSVESSAAVWDRFEELAAADPLIAVNLVPDCYLAAVALTHRARIATTDRDFARFPGVRHFNPLLAG